MYDVYALTDLDIMETQNILDTFTEQHPVLQQYCIVFVHSSRKFQTALVIKRLVRLY